MLQLDWLKVCSAAMFALGPIPSLSQGPFEPPTDQVLTEARSLVQRMIDNPRGPFARIAWFCNDGTVQPPAAFACADHGGGRQHGEYSAERQQLARLGWHVGTVFAALEFDQFMDAGARNRRMRELALERYLTDIDDGWVMRRARSYRGSVQVEGEEAAGNALLARALADRDWLAANFLLTRETVRVVPHLSGSDDTARAVRRDAIELAAADRSFEPIRAEIHGAASASTALRVRNWASGKSAPIATLATGIAADLDRLYGSDGRRQRLESMRRRLAGRPSTASIAAQLAFDPAMAPDERLARLADAMIDIRTTIARAGTDPGVRLLLFDLINVLESEFVVTADEALRRPELTRLDLLQIGRRLLDGCLGTGLLTIGEHAALVAEWEPLDFATRLSLEDYRRLIGYLRRAPQWAVGSVRYAFAEALTRYTALDARAGAFVDDMLRGSALVGVAEVSRRLSLDLAAAIGVSQNVAGATGVAAFGLNPGVARGRLRILATLDALATAEYGRNDIVVLPETVAELEPVAGIVTLGEGNPLSHVQLLARNFSIPNIAVLPEVLALLRPLEGNDVVAAVGSDSSVVLLPSSEVPTALLALAAPQGPAQAQLTVPSPDLAMRTPVPLGELHSELSGRVVGPKAANLGELARLFPGRVAPALAIPFGIFFEQLSRADSNIRDRLVDAYRRSAAGEIDALELDRLLAGLRADIAALRLDAEAADELQAAMAAEFGEPGQYGLFVRSDTNVEDLPQFTGAGLSETIPNVTDPDSLSVAIPRVWASVLSPRAIAWRSSLLTNPEEIYASVLLMKSVASEKSGVMVTTDLAEHAVGLTISTAWGVGGAVGGEAAETLVLHPDGSETLVSEAKTAYRRVLNDSGGLSWMPASDGAVLTAGDKRQLRALAREVEERYRPVYDAEGRRRPWDIEFGFVDGQLTLFQIRPLVERGPELVDRFVRALVPQRTGDLPTHIMLDRYPSDEPGRIR